MRLFESSSIFFRVCLIVILIINITVFPQGLDAQQDDSELQVLFEQALSESKEGDFGSALTRWDQFLDIAPNDAAALSNRGNVRLALGDVDGAIADQSIAIGLDPLEIDPYLNRGIAEELLHLWDDAASDYLFILGQDPENSSALYNLANVLGSQGDWEKAQDLYKRASISRPGFAMARSSQALSAYQLGDFDNAESQLRNIIRRYPMMADARAALSALLWRSGSFGEAESHWAAVAGLDNRYRDREWLVEIRRWPSEPTADLMAFLDLRRR
ncbi:tetratricopeptide repeat protein [Prochlorococcus sp. MIT 1300]|uniref:tetratricopeptide repeat protein n=1 Tax=Prochlorococcus sp. MIT 1300 TaxID=3096218 RepID=UPI002A74853F|nr:tetratricopeptide repeat protein [Prochlorococcus sp. MIT 1300]